MTWIIIWILDIFKERFVILHSEAVLKGLDLVGGVCSLSACYYICTCSVDLDSVKETLKMF